MTRSCASFVGSAKPTVDCRLSGSNTVDVASVDVAARDGRGHMVADEAMGEGGVETCHCGHSRATAWKTSPCSVEVASQTTASDVAASLRIRSSEQREGGRHCRRGHGAISEVVASDVVVWRGRGGCRIERMRLLDGCVVTAASHAAWRACKLLQGSPCSAVTGPRSLPLLYSRCSRPRFIHSHTELQFLYK